MCVCVRVRECVCVCVCVCQKKAKDRANGMRKKCPSPFTGFEPVPLGYAPIVPPITQRGQAGLASVETNTSDTNPPAPLRNTVMQRNTPLPSARRRRQASARTSTESDEACQRKTKGGADGVRKK